VKVLQLTVHLFPNIGGVETHLNDLFRSLIKRDWKVFALAYQPLSTKTDWKVFEKEKNLTILRIPWLKGFFEKLVHYPAIEFLYLVPGLFLVTPFIIIFYKPDILHAHGISASVPAVFWGKIFKIRSIVSLHSIYTFPKKGLYHNFVKLIFRNCDFVLSLSKKSNEEIQSLGVSKQKSAIFTYWINLEKFKKVHSAKKTLNWQGQFVVLFVGRLIAEKGIKVLIEGASLWDKKINLVIVGSGLLENYIQEQAIRFKNISFIGKISQDNLQTYYSGADCLIVPSTSEEGFGRVIIESLACQTPVIASGRGGIPEAMDKTVGRFIDTNAQSIKNEINFLYKNPTVLKDLAGNCREFAERRYSEFNVKTIIEAYAG